MSQYSSSQLMELLQVYIFVISILDSPLVCNKKYYHMFTISSIYLYLSLYLSCQMGGIILACQNLSHMF